MKNVTLVLIWLLFGCQGETETEGSESLSGIYPTTQKVDQVDDYHGTAVADPFRWLEDDVRESEQVASWVNNQNRITFDYLAAIPERNPIKERLTSLWDYEKYGIPFKNGERYFYFLNNGLQNQDVLYTQTSLNSEPQIVIDPNTLSEDGTVALADVEISHDGRYAAMAIQDGGSDWRTIRFLDVDSGKQLADEVQWMKFSPIVWAYDNSGVYYSRYPEPTEGAKFQSLNTNQAVYFHKLGNKQENDKRIYARPDHPDWNFSPELTEDGKYLVLTVWKGTDDRYQIVYIDMSEQNSKPVELITGFDFDYTLVGNDDDTLFFRTNNQAPKGRLIAIDLSAPAQRQQLIPESPSVLSSVELVGDHFLASYLKDARSQVIVFNKQGDKVRDVSLPGIGSASGFEGSFDDPETFYSYSSYNAPRTIYRYDVRTGESSLFKAADVDFDSEDYVVKQVFFPSKDGTQIPMFVSHKSDLKLSGDTPTLLYGYGGFNIPVKPAFSITRLAWMEMGGIYAVANLRGGGEYGEAWHKAGTKLQKQNVFDDFIAAGEYLVDTNYTNPDRLAVMGGSNGGLLVGAVSTLR